jgi:UDP-glucose 4-epimerase
LITGGAGFIGSHLAEALFKIGNEIVLFDNFSSGKRENLGNLKNYKIIEGDIRDKCSIEEAVKNSDFVFHFAASLGVRRIIESPLESITTNFHGSENVLNMALKYDRRVIIASTSEIYGKNPNQPLSENHDRVIGSPQKIRWTYSEAKALEESVANILFLNNNLKVTTLRFFNTVGPRQTGKYGMVIPRFITAAKTNSPLRIHGDGLQTRVFCHVLDAVEAILKISAIESSIGQVYNVGGEGEISILDLAKLIISKTNSQSKILFESYEDVYGKDFEDMQRRVPDITKIKNTIKWKPKRDLHKIIEDILESLS